MALRDLVPWHKVRREQEGPQALASRGPWEMGDWFNDFFRTWTAAPWTLLRGEGPGFAPAVNVAETDQEYRVSVELPGLSKDAIQVSVHEGQLIISGEKRQEEKEEKEHYLRVERSYGSFRRTIPLPASVDEEGVAASFKKGVLTVQLPKTAEARGKKIEIAD